MNVILIKTDQQRNDTLGCLGHPLVKTPHLDALAVEGIVCENAHAVSTLCVPSRTSFFTGRYGLVAKTKAFYDSLVRVPLIIRIPGLEQGRRIRANISNIDVMPTLLEAMGLAVTGPEDGIDGRSFYSLLAGEGPDEHRKELFAEVGRPGLPPEPVARESYDAYAAEQERERGVFWFIDYTVNGKSLMIKRDRWKYCFYSSDCDELYDVEADPWELENLSGREEFREVEEGLRKELMEWGLNP